MPLDSSGAAGGAAPRNPGLNLEGLIVIYEAGGVAPSADFTQFFMNSLRASPGSSF